jgi:ribosomal protein S18 acetylase RimI-like enzyme
MQTRVRRALPSDAAVIATVHIRSWQSAYRGQLPDSYLDQLGQELERRTQFWSSAITAPTIPGNEIWVIDISVSKADSESQSEVKGFATIGPTRDSDLAKAGEVYAIYLDPQSWGQELGRALFTHVSDRLAALGYPTAMLWVLESNARARRFYEMAGWTADGATKVETRPGFELHDVRYRKSLR